MQSVDYWWDSQSLQLILAFTIILVIGGLLSAHLLAKRMNVTVDTTWPCTGPLLDLAVALANKLLPGKINLLYLF